MPLNIGSTGDSTLYCKFNAKSGRLTINDLDGKLIELQGLTAIFDLERIQTGWLRFREGQAPERIMDPPGGTAPRPEGEGFKRGFVLSVYSQKMLGGVREMSGNSLHLCNAIAALYAEWEEQKDAHRGQVPVVTLESVQPMKDRYGTNYRPVFKIVKWVERPTELETAPPVASSGPMVQSPAGQTPVPPPQAAPAVQPVTDPLLEAEF